MSHDHCMGLRETNISFEEVVDALEVQNHEDLRGEFIWTRVLLGKVVHKAPERKRLHRTHEDLGPFRRVSSDSADRVDPIVSDKGCRTTRGAMVEKAGPISRQLLPRHQTARRKTGRAFLLGD